MTDPESPFPARTVRRAALAAGWLFLLVAPAAAQQTPEPAPATAGFLTRYDFHLSMTELNIDDKRFSWDARYGGDVDVVDYVRGRTAIAIDYEAVLGDQLRAFDPNQGNYILEVSSSARVGKTELVGVFHHVSRHLSDRPKQFAIAWNTFGARALRHWDIAGTTLDVNAEAAKMVAHAYVDYNWIGQLDVRVRRPVVPKADAFVHVSGQIVGIDSSLSNRPRQSGGLIEAGLRLKGRAGAIELFAGYEKRYDADPLDFLPQHWGMAGFRIVTR